MLEGLSKPKNDRLCGVMAKRKTLDESDQRILDEALADPEWSSYQLQIALASLGFRTAIETIRKHRAGNCICSRN